MQTEKYSEPNVDEENQFLQGFFGKMTDRVSFFVARHPESINHVRLAEAHLRQIPQRLQKQFSSLKCYKES